MFILSQLVFQSYIPEKLTKGMWFKQSIIDVIYGSSYKYDRLFELNHIPQDMDSYIEINGYPVKPLIMSITANPDNNADILATSDMIGWWDDGPQYDELRDVTMADLNYVLQHESGILDIEVTLDEEHAIPVLYDGKVTLRDSIDDDNDEEEEEWNDTEYPYDHPKDKSDYDPEDFETE